MDQDSNGEDTNDEAQRPDSLLPYDEWTETALRQVMVRALAHVAESGLPGDHHFYLTFRTNHPRTVVPNRLRAQYPEEMTIVLQHQFWNLQVDEEARVITVGLSFGGVPATLSIPFPAVTAFADPHVQFGLRFRPDMEEAETEAEPDPETAPDPSAGASEGPETPQVVSLDAFRRRPPTKS